MRTLGNLSPKVTASVMWGKFIIFNEFGEKQIQHLRNLTRVLIFFNPILKQSLLIAMVH